MCFNVLLLVVVEIVCNTGRRPRLAQDEGDIRKNIRSDLFGLQFSSAPNRNMHCKNRRGGRAKRAPRAVFCSGWCDLGRKKAVDQKLVDLIALPE